MSNLIIRVKIAKYTRVRGCPISIVIEVLKEIYVLYRILLYATQMLNRLGIGEKIS